MAIPEEPRGEKEKPCHWDHGKTSFKKSLCNLENTNFKMEFLFNLLSGVPDYFDRNKISSGGDLSHYSSASLY